jgi:tetratricopeptide (TPR) repeat protein
MINSGNKNLKKRLFLVLFGLTAAFLLLETGLRVAGYFYNAYRIKNRHAESSNENAVKILCIGDSYTFGQGAASGYSYPEQLERILHKNYPQHKFIVYNQGICGVNSSRMLKELPENLKRYNPDFIIIMAGMNNRWNLQENNYFLFRKGVKIYFCRVDAFLTHLRSYKLLKILVGSLRNKALQRLSQYRNSKKDNFGAIDDNRVVSMDRGMSKEANEHFKLGQEYLMTRELSLTEDAFKKAIELNPKNDTAYAGLGYCYDNQANLYQAEDAFKKAIEINPRHYFALVGLGDVYDRQGKYELAEKMFKKALEINPNSINAYGALWKMYWHAGKNSLALETIREELDLNPFDDGLRQILRSGLPSLPDDEEILDKVLEYDLENMIRLAKAEGKRCIFLTYPLSEENDEIRMRLANKWQILFVDNTKSFSQLKSAENYKQKDYFVEDGHCNARGYQVIAQNVYEALKSEMRLIE